MKGLSIALLGVAAVLAIGCKGNQQAASPAPAPAPASGTAAPAPAAPAPAVVSTVADLPDYPGSTRLKVESEAKTGFSKSVEAKYTSVDTFDNVKKFYSAAIAANGWQVTGTKEKAGEIKWDLSKGTSVGKVEIESERGSLRIKLERKDR